MARCEDYPCCGHTDGLGCDYDTSYYSSQKYHNHINLHYGCDHEAGWCAARPDDDCEHESATQQGWDGDWICDDCDETVTELFVREYGFGITDEEVGRV